MDADTRSRLFEPFFTTKGQGKSTGLGLSIVYGIVKQSGGDISVYSQPGAGTIFEIYIPKCREQEAAVRRAPHGPRGTETILVADDDDGVRKLVHAVLGTSGYTVIEAEDGKEALAVYQSDPGKFELVLTDVVMPILTDSSWATAFRRSLPSRRCCTCRAFATRRFWAWNRSGRASFCISPSHRTRCSRRFVRFWMGA